MSNIVVHTTPGLVASTGFINDFLDGLLEQYCSTRFQEGMIIADNVKMPTLDDLILNANPNYYRKAPGLYGHNSSTHVKVIYEASEHTNLQEALDHKLSRLFVNYIPKNFSIISFEQSESSFFRNMHMNLHDYRFRSAEFRDEIDFLDPHLLIRALKESGCSVTLTSDYADKFRTDLALVKQKTKFLVYKPTVEIFKDIDNKVYQTNEHVIKKNFFIANSSGMPCLWLSLHIIGKTSLGEYLQRCVTPSFFSQMKEKSNQILDKAIPHITAGLHTHIKEQKLKADSERERQQRLRQEQIEADRHTKMPEDVENKSFGNNLNIQKISETKEMSPQDWLLCGGGLLFISLLYMIFGR